jgi:hypothetical protein
LDALFTCVQGKNTCETLKLIKDVVAHLENGEACKVQGINLVVS